MELEISTAIRNTEFLEDVEWNSCNRNTHFARKILCPIIGFLHHICEVFAPNISLVLHSSFLFHFQQNFVLNTVFRLLVLIVAGFLKEVNLMNDM